MRKLCGGEGNWVRVGDPNQAIYETFTTASPQYLRSFLDDPGVISQALPISGRFSRGIMDLANFFIRWTEFDHPADDLRDSLALPYITPPPPGDEQFANVTQPAFIYVENKLYDSNAEVNTIVRSAKRWVQEDPDKTVVVLASSNDRGQKFVSELQKAQVPCIEMLRSDQATRDTADTLAAILGYLARPNNTRGLVDVYRCLIKREDLSAERRRICQQAEGLLIRLKKLEDFLAPLPDRDWLKEQSLEAPVEVIAELAAFRERVLRWQQAALLSVDQLILTVAQELFTPDFEPNPDGSPPSFADLALSHKLALLLERDAAIYADWRLSEFSKSLADIASNRTRLAGFQEEDFGFNPQAHKGEVVVTTIHKAKGLEWDRVYLTSANNFDFPSNQEYDSYVSEKYFVRGQLNLPAEALAKLNALMEDDLPGLYLEDGAATRAARVDYCSERLRLFYVTVTRACHDLIITCNSGRRQNMQPSLPMKALKSYWREGNNHDPAD